DEPTSALDLRYQIETLQLVRRITREEGISALIAIHDLNHAARYCDQVVVLHGGHLVADGSPGQALPAATLRSVYEVDVEVAAHEGAVEVRPRVDAAGFTRTGTRLGELADAVAVQPSPAHPAPARPAPARPAPEPVAGRGEPPRTSTRSSSAAGPAPWPPRCAPPPASSPLASPRLDWRSSMRWRSAPGRP